MTKKIFINVLLIAIFITLIGYFSYMILFVDSWSFSESDTEDWEKIYNMKYKEAMKYIGKHTKTISGFEVLKTQFSTWQSIWFSFKSMIWIFVVNILCAFIVAFRIIKLKKLN